VFLHLLVAGGVRVQLRHRGGSKLQHQTTATVPAAAAAARCGDGAGDEGGGFHLLYQLGVATDCPLALLRRGGVVLEQESR